MAEATTVMDPMLRPLKPKPRPLLPRCRRPSDGHHLSPDRWTEPAPGPAGHGRDYCVAHRAGVFCCLAAARAHDALCRASRSQKARHRRADECRCGCALDPTTGDVTSGVRISSSRMTLAAQGRLPQSRMAMKPLPIFPWTAARSNVRPGSQEIELARSISRFRAL